MQYAEEHMEDIPMTTLEWVDDTDELNEEDCFFDDEEDDYDEDDYCC